MTQPGEAVISWALSQKNHPLKNRFKKIVFMGGGREVHRRITKKTRLSKCLVAPMVGTCNRFYFIFHARLLYEIKIIQEVFLRRRAHFDFYYSRRCKFASTVSRQNIDLEKKRNETRKKCRAQGLT